ncbi:hypothetical protein RRG08_046833 [Elysia crispata]|uniref:Uncharacterized protein n=1 Tax=Elysia crispata TaxID=231223 RepID=A0AAE0ZN56_9GAST|nr:hypothetical protein RRG08_046833 [Elysia crispata]
MSRAVMNEKKTLAKKISWKPFEDIPFQQSRRKSLVITVEPFPVRDGNHHRSRSRSGNTKHGWAPQTCAMHASEAIPTFGRTCLPGPLLTSYDLGRGHLTEFLQVFRRRRDVARKRGGNYARLTK